MESYPATEECFMFSLKVTYQRVCIVDTVMLMPKKYCVLECVNRFIFQGICSQTLLTSGFLTKMVLDCSLEKLCKSLISNLLNVYLYRTHKFIL